MSPSTSASWGATAQRRGLSVHGFELKPQDAQTWHFVATLTQNLTRGAVNAGTVTLALEGTRDGRMQQLDWNALRQQPDAPGVDYSFKYFQQIEGDILLPPGLKPVRVVVRVLAARRQGGRAVLHLGRRHRGAGRRRALGGLDTGSVQEAPLHARLPIPGATTKDTNAPAHPGRCRDSTLMPSSPRKRGPRDVPPSVLRRRCPHRRAPAPGRG